MTKLLSVFRTIKFSFAGSTDTGTAACGCELRLTSTGRYLMACDRHEAEIGERKIMGHYIPERRPYMFAAEVRECPATFDRGTAYEGGIEYTHGLSEGSEPCTCGHGSHVVTSDGYIIPSIYQYDDRTEFDRPAAALGSAKSEKKTASSRANGAKGGRPRTKPTDV